MIISPEVKGKHITIRFSAPGADQVELKADFLPKREEPTTMGGVTLPMLVPIPVEMKKDKDGVWEYTAKNVKPDFYTYAIIVDGIETLDLNNLKIVRGSQSIRNVVIVPGKEMLRLKLP